MRTTHRLSAASLAAALLLSVTACGGSDDSDGTTSGTTTKSETSATPPPVPEPSETPAAAEQKQIAADETITDDDFGHTIKITGVVRDFVAPSRTNIPERGGEWVLVQLDVAAGDKYSGGVQGGFTLQSGGELGGTTTGIIDADMTAAGFQPWETASAGEKTKGWVAFQINTRSDAYTFQYKRGAAKIIGGGDTKQIPEKIWTVDLPTA
ncbi:hypothetical protein [Aeromicrobium wangtongii]|uniref:Uncharacterized protein n=1 Tax=Aeromicrobium wangtongii TaxID=2969247 RepID=A0ABY5M5U0_9ACTN|nr:hypothetical protein [Aeromicrobium wangtongii]MCD9198782.1 hypothetical protein [Aeromicrobium wangtongii]UUP13177.1 hypothetical protein NQV15_15135 [Aeromicrobium wangtongii]